MDSKPGAIEQHVATIGRRALVAGLARNCAAGLRATLPRLSRLAASFEETRFVIVTNDSVDETEVVLKAWAAGRTDTEIIVISGLRYRAWRRTHRLAICREAYLSVLDRDRAAGKPHDFLVVADLDGPNAHLIDEPDFGTAIAAAPADWAAVFANARTIYYDTWALRHPTWCPGDCWEPVWTAQWRLFGRQAAVERAIQLHVRARQISIDAHAPPIPVLSAFGGFGLYRTEYLAGAHYRGLTRSGGIVCEHVALHETIRQNGGALYILPALLNDGHEFDYSGSDARKSS
jgi:hypothetical protein